MRKTLWEYCKVEFERSPIWSIITSCFKADVRHLWNMHHNVQWADNNWTINPTSSPGLFPFLREKPWGRGCQISWETKLAFWGRKEFLNPVIVYNKRRFNIQDRKKLSTHNLSFPSRSLFQVMDLGVLSRDLYCESSRGRRTCSREELARPSKYFVWLQNIDAGNKLPAIYREVLPRDS